MLSKTVLTEMLIVYFQFFNLETSAKENTAFGFLQQNKKRLQTSRKAGFSTKKVKLYCT